MEVRKGNVSSIAPPAPEAENPMTVSEALNAVNTILLNYRGFDKVKAVLAAAQAVEDNKAAKQKELEDLAAQIKQAKDDLAKAKKQIAAAQGDQAKVLNDIEQTKKVALADRRKEAEDFREKMVQERLDFEADLKEQGRVAMVKLEDSIAGLKREQGALQKAVSGLKDKFDTLTQAVDKKTSEAAQVQSKLDTANAALEALRAKL